MLSLCKAGHSLTSGISHHATVWGRLATCSGLVIRLAAGAKPQRPITNQTLIGNRLAICPAVSTILKSIFVPTSAWLPVTPNKPHIATAARPGRDLSQSRILKRLAARRCGPQLTYAVAKTDFPRPDFQTLMWANLAGSPAKIGALVERPDLPHHISSIEPPLISARRGRVFPAASKATRNISRTVTVWRKCIPSSSRRVRT